jgi:ABC-type transport system involved in cytochrome bd biosynthesis fused ATPase/permease subunit
VFPGAVTPSLDGLSLHVRAGDYVALMGASGSGKTTLLKLVAGAVLTQRGAVRGVAPRSVAIVSQRPELLIGSVRDNIAFGHECSQEDVEQAARDAEVRNVIERLPEKYDTVLGDDEASRGLSGGEQLRLTLARALCRQPALLVLDECTAALDSASEAVVLANLARVHQQRRTTVLMATHSHAAAAAADHVVLLAQGRVVEQGPYAALLQQNGALWRLQQVVQHGIPATSASGGEVNSFAQSPFEIASALSLRSDKVYALTSRRKFRSPVDSISPNQTRAQAGASATCWRPPAHAKHAGNDSSKVHVQVVGSQPGL